MERSKGLVGKIDEDGYLRIKRGEKFKPVVCPFSVDGGCYNCGDWCALFGEPELWLRREGRSFILSLCHKVYVFDELIDERKEAENDLRQEA